MGLLLLAYPVFLVVLYPLVIPAPLLLQDCLLDLEYQHLQQVLGLLVALVLPVGLALLGVQVDQLLQKDQVALDSLLAPEALELPFFLGRPVFHVGHYFRWPQALPYRQEDLLAHLFPLPHPPQLILAPP